VLTSDNESTTSRAFCLHARWRLGSRASRQDQEVTSPAPEETSFCLQTVYLQPTLRAFYQFRSSFQPTRRRNFGLDGPGLCSGLPVFGRKGSPPRACPSGHQGPVRQHDYDPRPRSTGHCATDPGGRRDLRRRRRVGPRHGQPSTHHDVGVAGPGAVAPALAGGLLGHRVAAAMPPPTGGCAGCRCRGGSCGAG